MSQTNDVQRYQTPSFAIELPPGCTEDSLHIIKIPSGTAFQASLVIRRQPLAHGGDMAAEMRALQDQLRPSCPGWLLLDERVEKHADLPAFAFVYDWSHDSGVRVRQRCKGVLARDKSALFTLTATHLTDSFQIFEGRFEEVLRTFRPLI